VYRFTKRPGVICFCFCVDDESDLLMWVETQRTEVDKVSGSEGQPEATRDGLLAVLAEHSTDVVTLGYDGKVGK